ncbi:MAG: YceI family protein [Bacteroidota bacterium]
MKKLNLLMTLMAFIGLTAFTSSTLNNWTIEEDYEIRFDSRGAKGTFQGLNGVIVFDENNLQASNMDVSAEVATISTGNKTKDKHAKGKNWLDAKAYPQILFKSSEFKKVDQTYEVTGDLELHGVTKKVTIPFTFEEEGTNGTFKGALTVDRKDYGITGPLFGFTVGNEITIELKVPVKK